LREVEGRVGFTHEICDLAYFRKSAGQRSFTWEEHPDGRIVRRVLPFGIRFGATLTSERPERLVVLTGDSHLAGVVQDDEVTSAVLEGEIRDGGFDGVAVLNTACGYYTFPNDLGVATRFARLEPDVFVVIIFGGNDFGGLLPMQAQLEGDALPRRPEGYFDRIETALANEIDGRGGKASLWQGFNQLASFAANPELVDRTLELALDYSSAIEEVCERRGTDLIMAYLPPPGDAGEIGLKMHHDGYAEMLDLDVDALGATNRMADRFLDGLESMGVRTVDLRPALIDAAGPNYWVRDEHLNVNGHRIVAERLGPVLTATLAERADR
jgi:hypothetical protein